MFQTWSRCTETPPHSADIITDDTSRVLDGKPPTQEVFRLKPINRLQMFCRMNHVSSRVRSILLCQSSSHYMFGRVIHVTTCMLYTYRLIVYTFIRANSLRIKRVDAIPAAGSVERSLLVRSNSSSLVSRATSAGSEKILLSGKRKMRRSTVA